MADDQRDVIAFLENPANYGGAVDQVERLETHISLVFLAGDRAYKLKRAVKYPYLDFSTARLREEACVAELRLNRRTAPDLYLEIKTIGREASGCIVWDRGTPIDYVVVMRRFEQERLLDAVAQKGGLDPPLIYALAAHIASFHQRAEIRRGGGSAAMARVAANAIACLRDCTDAGFDAERVGALDRAWKTELDRLGPLLDRRRDAGRVRRCHGDLHLRNICLLDRGPALFDCLEFSEDLATVDVLYDLAFLLMDMVHRGHCEGANRLFNRYLDLTTEEDGLGAIPFFLSLRAAIRAYVSATGAHFSGGDAAMVEAHRYLDLSGAALSRPAPVLVAIGGLSGTGKSVLAAQLAPGLGRLPGARVLRSDVLRKRRFGVLPETALPNTAYTPAETKAVYAELCDKATSALGAGYSAIIDAVSLASEERDAFAAAAREADVRFLGFWLEAPTEVMAERIRGRRSDASDATTRILQRQLRSNSGPVGWRRVDASGPPEATLGRVKSALAMT